MNKSRLFGWWVGAFAACLPLAGLAQEEPAYRGWTRGRDLSWTPSAITNRIPRYRALVIGINRYQTPPPVGWESLATARQDAEAVAEVLARDYGFEVRALYDEQATRAAIMSALDDLSECTIDDAVLIYYAGHGFFDPNLGEGFWIPSDARRKAGSKTANQDWIWNSVLTKIIGASQARHVLVVADSCYGGSLFRGEGLDSVKPDLTWYARAITTPSRYLITSGDLEPVLDTGARHSIFCQAFLNYVQYPKKDVFSASDVGVSIREQVSTLTAQMPRMGPLSVVSHAGGEFVFVRQGATIPEDAVASPVAGQAVRGPESAPAPSSRELLRDAVLLSQQGATGAAHRLLAMAPAGANDATLVKAVTDYLDRDREQKSREELRGLIRQLEERKHNAQPADAGAARPRLIACLGPDSARGGGDDEAEALLYRISLRAALEEDGRVRVVERDALEAVLQEMDLGASELADPDLRTATGKVLPASFLLLGTLLSRGETQQLLMRVVDTETTLALGSFSQSVGSQDDVMAVAGRIADAMIARLIKEAPLTARVETAERGQLRAAVGRLHGAREGSAFQLVRRAEGLQESIVGTAAITELGDKQSVLKVVSGEVPAEWATHELWVRESIP